MYGVASGANQICAGLSLYVRDPLLTEVLYELAHANSGRMAQIAICALHDHIQRLLYVINVFLRTFTCTDILDDQKHLKHTLAAKYAFAAGNLSYLLRNMIRSIYRTDTGIQPGLVCGSDQFLDHFIAYFTNSIHSLRKPPIS